MEALELVFDPLPGEALVGFLRDQVINLNYARTATSEGYSVGYFLKNTRGEYLGGLTGYVWGGWFHVDFVWVAEFLRGHGHGSHLMDAAEAFAVERDALAATLETHSFQAPEFYMKRGYEIFGQLDDYPPGHSKLFMRKKLEVAPR